MSVIDFAAAKKERTPHWHGRVVCMGCRHEWEAVGEVGDHVGLECPSCGFPKGIHKYLWGAQQGDLELRCICGCEAINAYKRDGFMRVKCMACGSDLTEAFFE